MVSLLDIGILLIAHFLYDFVLQPYSISSTKALKTISMGKHILTVLIVTFVAGVLLLNTYPEALFFAIIYTFTHFIIDTFIWNGYKRLRNYNTSFEFWSDHVWYKFLAIDQLSHIFLLMYILIVIRS